MTVTSDRQGPGSPSPGGPVLACTGIAKSFGSFAAVRSVDLDLAAGEVRALIGANGAGKSTLVRIMSGQVQPTAGTVSVDGKPVTLTNPATASKLGIEVVHQELSLIPNLSVAENITLGHWPRTRLNLVDRRLMWEQASEALDRLAVTMPPLSTPVSRLSPAQRQLVEIAKAIVNRPRVLILDEPTSSLGGHEVSSLLDVVNRLSQHGVAMIYVSHRMDEIHRVADSLTILRGGAVVASGPAGSLTTRQIAYEMAGAELQTLETGAAREPRPEVALRVERLSTPDLLCSIDLAVHAGEVVGISGLLGSGRTELLRAIMGIDRVSEGTVTIHGHKMSPSSITARIRAGVGFVPEDRRNQGLVLSSSVSENLVMACYRVLRHPFVGLSGSKQRAMTRRSVDDLSIACSNPQLPVGTLSGGNQQKVVFGKWLNRGCTIFLLDEPTRGVDVHAKAQIYSLIHDMAERGATVLFVSSEEEEMYKVCHRIIVLRSGRVVADRDADDLPIGEALELAMGEAA